MYRFFLVFSLLFFINFSSQAQQQYDSPYELNWAVDGPYLGASLGLNYLGLRLIRAKDHLSEDDLNSLSEEDIWGIDRWAAGNYSPDADKLSNVPFFGAVGLSLLFLIDEDERKHMGQISVLLLESLATTGALFTITAGLVEKSRPFVYNQDLPTEKRLINNSQRSFFAGHVAVAATGSFFAAKVFSDFNPDSWAKPYVWTLAALIPAWAGYLRIESGNHFLTDTIIGYAIGAASGILIPELHKKGNENFSLTPTFGSYYKGLSLNYRF